MKNRINENTKTKLLRHAERAMNAATDAAKRAGLAYEEAKWAQTRARENLNLVLELISDQ